jgi:hypothetical protein
MNKLGGLMLACVIAACGGTAVPASAPTSSTVAAPVATATAGATTAATASLSAVTQASANNATSAQITAALASAGVPNPDRWTIEVIEYRPYAVTDTSFTKLRGQLAKYNPAVGVVDKIVSALSLP